MLAQLPAEVVTGAIGRIVIYGVALLVCAHYARRYPLVTAGLALGILTAVLTLCELRATASLVSIPLAGCMAWVCVDRCRNDPRALRARLEAEQADWSDQRHELAGELAIERLRRRLAEQKAGD